MKLNTINKFHFHITIPLIALTGFAFSYKAIERKYTVREQALCTVSLTGNQCIGSTLSITSSEPVKSITWLLDGQPVLEQSIDKQNNGQVVAGGNGSGSAMNQLNNPSRLFVDAAGSIYIPDMTNNRVQKWLPGATSGITVAGGNGVGNQANQFNRPTGITVDAQGNIFVADQNNGRVQKWAVGATSGTTIASGLNVPTDVCFDKNGNLYVSEQRGSGCVRKYTNAIGVGEVVAGDNGYGSAANQLSAPTGIFVDSKNNLYVCDTENSRIQKWLPGAVSGTTVGRVSGNPLGVYVDAGENIFVADYTSFSVIKIPVGSMYGVAIAGGNGEGSNPNQIKPVGVVIDNLNNLYIADFLNARIIKFGNVYTGSYTANVPGKYTAKIVTNSGCTITSNEVVVKPNRNLSLTIASTSNFACSNYQPLFTATYSGNSTTSIFQWKVNEINVPYAQASFFNPTFLKAGDIVSCSLTDNDDCVLIKTVISNAITIELPTEIPQVTINTDINNVCAGSQIKLLATTINAGYSPQYQWFINDKPTGNNMLSFESTDFKDGDEVHCVITSNAPYCQRVETATSNKIKIKIIPILTPSIAIANDVKKIYRGSKITFSSITINQGGSPQYEWQINGQAVSFEKNFTTTSLKDGDKVICKLSADLPCPSINNVFSNTLDIFVEAVIPISPPSAFTPNGDGINDFWSVENLALYKNCKIYVFNRYGNIVYTSIGYDIPWDGFVNNKACPIGAYYYKINLDGNKIITGSVSIIR